MYIPPIHFTYIQDDAGHVSNCWPTYDMFDPMGRGFISSFNFDKDKQLVTFTVERTIDEQYEKDLDEWRNR